MKSPPPQPLHHTAQATKAAEINAAHQRTGMASPAHRKSPMNNYPSHHSPPFPFSATMNRQHPMPLPSSAARPLTTHHPSIQFPSPLIPTPQKHLVTIIYPTSNKAAIAIANLTTHKPSRILGLVFSCKPPPPLPENHNHVFINLPFIYTNSTNCIVIACPHSTAHVLTTEEIQQSHYNTYHPNILKMLVEGPNNVHERLNWHLCTLHYGAICLSKSNLAHHHTV